MFNLKKRNKPNYENARTLAIANRYEGNENYIVDDYTKILDLPIINKVNKNKELNKLEDKTKSIQEIVPTLTLLIMSIAFMSSLGLFTSLVNMFLCVSALTKKLKMWQFYYFGINLMITIPMFLFVLTAYVNVLAK